jgi:hypothetical protein
MFVSRAPSRRNVSQVEPRAEGMSFTDPNAMMATLAIL